MKALRAYLIGLLLGGAGLASAAGVSTIAGPVDPGSWLSTINALIASMNTNLATLASGEISLSQTNAFSANGVVATAMSSLGPVGSHTTIQEWLVVIDPAGNVRFVPCF